MYDFLHARVLSIKLFVSFKDACWKPNCSQSSFTDGTRPMATVGFDGIVGQGNWERNTPDFASCEQLTILSEVGKGGG